MKTKVDNGNGTAKAENDKRIRISEMSLQEMQNQREYWEEHKYENAKFWDGAITYRLETWVPRYLYHEGVE